MEENCRFIHSCPKLKRELEEGAYGYCIYQPEFQRTCEMYIHLEDNPSRR